MKKEIFYSVISIALLTSCNNKPAASNKTEDSVYTEKTAVTLTGRHCYQYKKDKDSVMLNVDINGINVTGRLHYSLYEKDSNEGVVKGELKNDTLFADYTFKSEGMQSIREVAFLLTDSTAKEGYGEMIEKNDKMVFANLQNISFNNSFILIKESCK